MLLRRMMVQLRRLGGAPESRDLLDPDQLRCLLARERARTDRTGRPFSLLVFAQWQPRKGSGAFQPVLRVLKKRLRFTDVIGLLEERRLGVVLPETAASGAWKVADDVLSALPQGSPPLCEVYTYPSEWSDLPGDESVQEVKLESGRPVQPMELLFVRRMPPWKRGFDIVGASVGLVFAAPVLLVAAAAIKATSPGPALFRQWRSGTGSQPFLMYKLRTMSLDAEARKQALLEANEGDGPAFKMKDDPRVTRLGRFLRRTSIDELPQLWNVLKGDMSLVGPRPLPCDETAACHTWQKNRLDVTPGLTCTCQVQGRSDVGFDDWMRLDLRYVRSRSAWADLRLVLKTAIAVLHGRGAY